MTIRRKIICAGDEFSGLQGSDSFGFSNTTAPAANTAYFVPFVLEESFSLTHLFWVNGASASGNADIGVYDANGNLKVSAGSTVKVGVNSPQVVNVTDTTLAPGLYFFGYSQSGVTTLLAAGNVMQAQLGGCYQMASAFALPAAATFASPAGGIVPFMGMENGAIIL